MVGSGYLLRMLRINYLQKKGGDTFTKTGGKYVREDDREKILIKKVVGGGESRRRRRRSSSLVSYNVGAVRGGRGSRWRNLKALLFNSSLAHSFC